MHAASGCVHACKYACMFVAPLHVSMNVCRHGCNVCMYALYVCECVYVCVCMHACMDACRPLRASVVVHACVHVCIYKPLCTYDIPKSALLKRHRHWLRSVIKFTWHSRVTLCAFIHKYMHKDRCCCHAMSSVLAHVAHFKCNKTNFKCKYA